MGPRSADEPIGEFSALAFIVNKKFKKANNVENLDQIQNDEEKKALEA